MLSPDERPIELDPILANHLIARLDDKVAELESDALSEPIGTYHRRNLEDTAKCLKARIARIRGSVGIL